MVSDGNAHLEPHDLKGRILLKMKLGDTQGSLKRILKNQFSSAMADEVIVMDRKHREQLFNDVVRIILEETLRGFEEDDE